MTTRLLAVLAICLAASLPYLPSLGNYFVNDDFGVVQLLSQKPPFYFPKWFVTSWMDDIWGAPQDEIRPFPAVTYQLAAIWGATSPMANHVTNIAFHAANALLVLAIARTVAGVSFIASVYAALAFAILPLHAESVAWITGRVDTIPAMFFLGSFLAYARWRRGDAKSTGALPVLDWVVFLRPLQQTEHHRHGGNTVPVRSRGRATADPRLVVVAGALRSFAL